MPSRTDFKHLTIIASFIMFLTVTFSRFKYWSLGQWAIGKSFMFYQQLATIKWWHKKVTFVFKIFIERIFTFLYFHSIFHRNFKILKISSSNYVTRAVSWLLKINDRYLSRMWISTHSSGIVFPYYIIWTIQYVLYQSYWWLIKSNFVNIRFLKLAKLLTKIRSNEFLEK